MKIEEQKIYRITLSEYQLKELYELLKTEKESGHLTYDGSLMGVYVHLRNFMEKNDV